LLLWLGAFVAWAAVSYLGTEYPETVWQQLLAVAKVWVVALIAVNALRTRRQIRLFIVAAVVFFALYPARGAIFNYVFYRSDLWGRAIWNFIYSNPNDLAAITLLLLSLAGALVASERAGIIKYGAFASVIVLPILLLMTQSRGAILGLCTAVALLVVSQGQKVRTIVVLVMLGLIAAFVAPSGVWDRLSGLSKATSVETLSEVDAEGSAQERFAIWVISTRIIRDHPVFGVGLGAYPLSHSVYAGGDGVLRRKDTHSTYLNVLAETGIPGLIVFLGIIVVVLYPAEQVRRRCRRHLPRSAQQLLYVELGLVAFLTAGVFGSFAKLSFLYVDLALIWALSDVCRRDLERLTGSRHRLPRRVSRRLALSPRPPPIPADS
jgi:probable O-glycosylation ligase (exosortase A-associated)